MTGRPVTAAQHALTILDVEQAADARALRRAFHRAVKAVHPDRAGGDAVRFRAVVDAYRLLAKAPLDRRNTQTRPERDALLVIDPVQAMTGGAHGLDGGRRVQLPPGLRHGDRVRLGGALLTVLVRGDAKASVIGDHLCLTVPVEADLLRTGGRLAIGAPNGLALLWISAREAARGLARVRGGGLPARGSRPRGDLIVRLVLAEDDRERPAVSMRRRFIADWAA